jgi:hypothetical protein
MFGSFSWKYNKDFDENQDFTIGKTNISFSLMSNCEYCEGRIEYLKSLQQYMPVDFFGKCGMPCPNEKFQKDIDCFSDLLNKYKFFFAFENSFCHNYVIFLLIFFHFINTNEFFIFKKR